MLLTSRIAWLQLLELLSCPYCRGEDLGLPQLEPLGLIWQALALLAPGWD